MTKQSKTTATRINAAVAARKARIAAGLPAYRTPGEVATANPKSLRAALDAMCWECLGSGDDAGWKWGIGNCTSPQCSLFTLRPYQHKLGQPEEGVYIRGDK